ncbi:MAG: hypothetical protein U1C58_06125 [Flavobacteriaceae bacterium]|nr:hypothetical protein [Flavobacteriaceae bacterium]MDZ4147841.1 hypothetical protein [Flavobacteriaceae bacterium]
MNKIEKFQNSTEARNDGNTILAAVFSGFFSILWIVVLALWITFLTKGKMTEMWIANAFMWIGVFGLSWSKNIY